MFDPRDFFSLAQSLAQDTTSEASQRSAIGRAYYCCYLTTRDRFFGPEGIGITNPVRKAIMGKKTGGVHEVVIQAMGQCPALPPGKRMRLKNQLDQLRAMRVEADYHMDSNSSRVQQVFSKNSAPDWPGLAREALTLTSNLLPELRLLPSYS